MSPPELCIHCTPVDDCPDCLPGGETVDRFIRAHPGGATIVEIAAALGVSKQAVAQTEARVMRKLRAAAGAGTEDDARREEDVRRRMRESYHRRRRRATNGT